jgi:hypothetical protein
MEDHMKLVTGLITGVLFIGAGNQALASMAVPATPVDVQSSVVGPTSESAGESAQGSQTGKESATNNAVSISGTTEMVESASPPVLITGNIVPSSTALPNLATVTTALNQGHGGFFFDNAESRTGGISIARVSPPPASITVSNFVPLSEDMQPSTTPVPLPPALLFAGSGLTGLIAVRRKIRPV